MFKLWSESNPDSLFQLKPNLGLRSWNSLSIDEKNKIWIYLDNYFFNYPTLEQRVDSRMQVPFHGVFNSKYVYSHILQDIIEASIRDLNEKYKYNSYAKKYLKSKTPVSACFDFYDIFHTGDEVVLLDLLGIYCIYLIKEGNNYFDNLVVRLNEVFEQFGINVALTIQGFIPRQGAKITQEIYLPTLDYLNDIKFKEANRDLGDAFNDYQKGDYSGCVTKVISAIQAFLQISVRGEIGKGDISKLIKEAINDKLIPDDIFTKTIFDNIESIIMRERQEKGDPHPKLEYANEQNARLILNLSMVFIQHFMQLQK